MKHTRARTMLIITIASLLLSAAALLALLWGTGRLAWFAPRFTPMPAQTPAPQQTPLSTAPAPTETPLAVARIRAAGDVIIDEPLLTAAYSKGSYKFGRYFEYIADELADADLTVINVEGSIGGLGEYGYSGYPSFNTPPSLLSLLKTCSVDMLTLANNHALDRYFDGLLKTIKNVDQAGLARVGAYRSQKEYDTPMIVELNGIKIGITNYTTSLNGLEKYSDKRALSYGLRTFSRADIEADLRALREAGAQAIVVFAHWDREYKRAPSNDTRKLAERLAAAGADVIIGGHPHMVQPIERVESGGRSALMLFSMGNFLSNHKGEYLDNGIIFEVSFALREDGQVHVVDPKYLPVWVWVHKDDDGRNNYQVMPIAKTLQSRPEAMTDAQYERMRAAWQESLDVLGTNIATPAS